MKPSKNTIIGILIAINALILFGKWFADKFNFDDNLCDKLQQVEMVKTELRGLGNNVDSVLQFTPKDISALRNKYKEKLSGCGFVSKVGDEVIYAIKTGSDFIYITVFYSKNVVLVVDSENRHQYFELKAHKEWVSNQVNRTHKKGSPPF